MMKSIILITLIGLLGMATVEPYTGIEVVVSEANSEEVVMFAKVSLFSEDSLVVATTTNFDGKSMFWDLSAGLYEVEVEYLGYEANRKTVSVTTGEVTRVSFHMAEGTLLDCVEVVAYKVPLVEMDNTSCGVVISEVVTKPSLKARVKKLFSRKKSAELSALPTKQIAHIAATSAGISVSDETSEVISVRGSMADATLYHIDGVRLNKSSLKSKVSKSSLQNCKVVKQEPLPPTQKVEQERSDEEVSPADDADEHLQNATQEAGQLTAAEWNDLTNWKDWLELTQDGVYTDMLDYWQLPMGDRITVLVTNENNFPLPNCKVLLMTLTDTVVWEGTTDNNGKVELWQHPDRDEATKLIVGYEDESFDFHLQPSKRHQKMDQTIQLPVECETTSEPLELDIMFVVDATGSMSDEIAYLKAELTDVVEQVAKSDENLEIRVGSVFYKDKWDDFLTAKTDLSTDVSATISFMEEQLIGGGADFPEAVEAGLGVALAQDWNEKAINRIIFLLLDAPPHYNPEVLAKLQNQVAEAAALGIKLIPITASGIDRETEYLMKQLAMMTNGTYVFLTDDSGIGEQHLTHAIPDYDVEKLNALIVRLISGYAHMASCEAAIEKPVVVSYQAKSISAELYPSPAIDQLTLELSAAVDRVVITTSTGRRVQQIEGMTKGKNTIVVSDFISGRYNLTIISGGGIVNTLPFLVVS